ncbi:MAG: choice-of-anchor Q domain-containing protein [Verrucomicrobiota bacterium]
MKVSANLLSHAFSALFLLLILALFLLLAQRADAVPLSVTSTADSGGGSLRDVIAIANGNGTDDTITFSLPAGVQTITLTSGQIPITESLTITGNPDFANRVIISGNDNSRIFEISGRGAGVTLENLVIRDGFDAPLGGGILAFGVGNLYLYNCAVTDCSALGGGGIYVSSTPITLENSSLTNNTAIAGEGGGLGANSQSVVSLLNTTVSGNSATSNGGGLVLLNGTGALINSTITDNTADSDVDNIGDGGGIRHVSFGATLQNTVVAGNHDDSTTTTLNDLSTVATITSLGNNLIGEENPGQTTALNGINGDIIGTPASPALALLASLSNNGGMGRTHLPTVNSPLIDAGDNTIITDPPFAGPTFLDGRGNPRIDGAAVEIGAVESGFTFTVTNTNNTGIGSFRKAVEDAVAAGTGVVAFDPTVFGSSPQTITLTGGQIAVTAPIIINGPFPNRVTIDADNVGRIFDITSSGTDKVTLSNLRFINGDRTTGGAMRVAGGSTVVCGDNLVFEDNTANNNTASGGGALLVDNATVSITDSAFVDNDSAASGGAVAVQNNGDLDLTNVTVSGNTADTSGGGIMNNGGTVDLASCTITNNTADDNNNATGTGGGVGKLSTAVVRAINTIIAANLTNNTSPDINGAAFTSQGNNIIGDPSGATGFTQGALGDQVGTAGTPLNPLLDTIADNGGDTLTHHLQSGSPAINAGNNTAITGPPFDNPTVDQRGQRRIFNGTVDVGAYERPLNSVVSVTSNDVTLQEAASLTLEFYLTRTLPSGTLDADIEIDATSTATENVDYTLTGDNVSSLGSSQYRISFDTDEPAAAFFLNLNDDNSPESTETVIVKLLNVAGYQIDPVAANGNSVTVTILDDDATVTTAADSGPGSLRELVAAANANTDGGSVNVPSSLGPITLSSQIEITSAVQVVGSGPDLTTITGNGSERIFQVNNPTSGCARFENLIITGGNASGASQTTGGGINALLNSCIEIDNCAITDNTASDSGGGIHCLTTTLTITNSSIDNNTASTLHGGGIALTGNSPTSIANTTLAHNTCEKNGGGLHVDDFSDASIAHCTITKNTADGGSPSPSDGGGGIWVAPFGGVDIINTIVAGNFDSPNTGGESLDNPDVNGVFFSDGYNLIGNANGSTGFNETGDQAGTFLSPLDPLLVQCTNAIPMFYTLDPASPALDAGDNSATDIAASDQRGYGRIWDSGTTDIGSTELDYFRVENTAVNGVGSLRDRISDAITLGHGTITFNTSTVFATPQTLITGGSGAIPLTGEITIFGPSVSGSRVTIDAGNADRIFNCTAGNIALKNLTLINGDTTPNLAADQNGGAVHVDNANLTLHKCTLDNNTAAGVGGAIFTTFGALDIRETTISNNLAQGGDGGGVYDSGGNIVYIEASTFHDNRCTGNGGGMIVGDTATVYNSTFSANLARGSGGGVAVTNSSAELTMKHCTITLNVADNDSNGSGDGGGIFTAATAIGKNDYTNCIIAENSDKSGSAADYSGPTSYLGFGLVGDITGATPGPPGFGLFGTAADPLDPQLRPLADNGGCTPTHALRWDSPAVNALPSFASEEALYFDQRGINARFNSSLANLTADLGSYELTYKRLGDADTQSLEDAIALVNSTGDGIITWIDTAPFTITLDATLVVTGNLCLQGNTQGVTLDGDNTVRVLELQTGSDREMVVDGVTIANGDAGNQNGGGILTAGFGTVAINNCTITNCDALNGGGIVFANDNTANVNNSTISGNTAENFGGGIWNTGSDLTLRSVTITDNTCDDDQNNVGEGGGLYHALGTCSLRNTIVAGNQDKSASNVHNDVDTVLSFTSLTHNLIGDSNGAIGLTDGVNSDQVGVAAPMLGSLADNGGPTDTHALLLGSPAIDMGTTNNSFPTDQRGNLRVINGTSDIGAYEAPLFYDTFAAQSFPGGTPPAEIDPFFDFDGDGLLNVIEFIIGSIPTVQDNSGQVKGQVVGTDLILEFPRDVEVDPAIAVVQHSTDLGLTDAWSATGVTVNNLGPHTIPGTELIQALIPMGTERNLFARLLYVPLP